MVNRPHRRPSRTADRPPLPDQIVTVSTAAAAGWTEGARRHAVRVGDFEPIQRGVLGLVMLTDTSLIDRQVREAENLRTARAAALMCPRAAISHVSAAISHSMPTLGDVSRACLTVPAGTALRSLARVHLHRAAWPDQDVVSVDGYRTLSPARTVMDLARERGVGAGVIAADYALHCGLVDAAALAAAYEVCARWPGRKAARIALLSADGDSESPLESLSRLRIAGHGIPKPGLQPEICDQNGRFLGRCDFYWDEFGVVGEADGDVKYESGQPAVVAERERQKLLEQAGLIVVRWSWSDLYAFGDVAWRLRAAFRRGARHGSPDRRWGILRRAHRLHP
jgi:hypothetical protein